MRLAMLHLFAIGWSIGTTAPGLPQDGPGNVASGRKIAETWCAACHQIDLQKPETADTAPGFAQIAKLPSTTALALNVFLHRRCQVNFCWAQFGRRRPFSGLSGRGGFPFHHRPQAMKMRG